MKILTTYDPPPIPDRRFDWLAYDDDSFDGPESPWARGPTREAAIADLLEKIEESAE
jgi:hypothetical protein